MAHVSMPTNPKFVNRIGQVFGKRTIIAYAGQNRHGQAVWLCQCKCGKLSKPLSGNLVKGTARSCGCIRVEQTTARFTTHGEAGVGRTTPEYGSYISAKSRCDNPQNQDYQDYGGRGVKFLFGSFPEFLAEVGRKPTPRHSIDRKDPNGDYCKGNIRWATDEEQANNKRNTHRYHFQGAERTITEISKITGRNRSLIWSRVYKGWCIVCAATLPTKWTGAVKRCAHPTMLSDKTE